MKTEWVTAGEVERASGLPSRELEDPEHNAIVNVTPIPREGLAVVSLSLVVPVDDAESLGEHLLAEWRPRAWPR